MTYHPITKAEVERRFEAQLIKQHDAYELATAELLDEREGHADDVCREAAALALLEEIVINEAALVSMPEDERRRLRREIEELSHPRVLVVPVGEGAEPIPVGAE